MNRTREKYQEDLLKLLHERGAITLSACEATLGQHADEISILMGLEVAGTIKVYPQMWEKRDGKLRKLRPSYRTTDLVGLPGV